MALNPWRGLRDLPAEAWIIFATTLVNRAGTMVLPFLVLYLTQDLGHPAGRAGFALTAYGLGGLISAPLAGRLSDRVGALRVMQLSLLLSGALLLVLPLARSPTAVFSLIFLWAVISEAVRPASLAALAGATPPAQRKAAIALNRLAINLGMSVGPAVGGFLAMVSFFWLFAIDGATSIAAAALLTGLLSRKRAVDGADAIPPVPSAAGALRDRRMLTFMLAWLLVGVMFFQLDAAFPLYVVRELGLSQTFFGLLFTLNTVLIVFLEVPLNLATADWPHRWVLVLGTLGLACGFGALVFATGPGTIALAVVVLTFGEMILFPVAATYVAELAPADRQGEYMGAFWMALSLAMMVGPWAGTVVMDRFGSRVLWISVFACGLATAGIFGLVVSPGVRSARAGETSVRGVGAEAGSREC
jgi:predicted MFS family arabinose efflux permease